MNELVCRFPLFAKKTIEQPRPTPHQQHGNNRQPFLNDLFFVHRHFLQRASQAAARCERPSQPVVKPPLRSGPPAPAQFV